MVNQKVFKLGETVSLKPVFDCNYYKVVPSAI
jgi:hypothetical protein